MKYLIFFCLTIISFPGCQGRQKNNVCREISIPMEYESDSLFFDNFELEKIVVLENNNQAAITTMDRIIVNDDYILVFSKHVYKFDLNGKYVCQIGEQGNGPGEYHRILDVAIDEKDNVFIFSDNGKILSYTTAGQYIGKVNLDKNCFFTNFSILDGHSYFYNIYNIHNNVLYQKTGDSFDSMGDISRNDFSNIKIGELFVKGKSILFSQKVSNVIYEIKDNTVSEKIRIKFNNFINDEEKYKYSNSDGFGVARKLYNEQIVWCMNSIKENSNGLFFRTNLGDIFWVEPNGVIHKFKNLTNQELSAASLHYFAHDSEDDMILLYANPHTIKAKQKKCKSTSYESILSSIEEDSNPVLFFYKHK